MYFYWCGAACGTRRTRPPPGRGCRRGRAPRSTAATTGTARSGQGGVCCLLLINPLQLMISTKIWCWCSDLPAVFSQILHHPPGHCGALHRLQHPPPHPQHHGPRVQLIREYRYVRLSSQVNTDPACFSIKLTSVYSFIFTWNGSLWASQQVQHCWKWQEIENGCCNSSELKNVIVTSSRGQFSKFLRHKIFCSHTFFRPDLRLEVLMKGWRDLSSSAESFGWFCLL